MLHHEKVVKHLYTIPTRFAPTPVTFRKASSRFSTLTASQSITRAIRQTVYQQFQYSERLKIYQISFSICWDKRMAGERGKKDPQNGLSAWDRKYWTRIERSGMSLNRYERNQYARWTGSCLIQWKSNSDCALLAQYSVLFHFTGTVSIVLIMSNIIFT